MESIELGRGNTIWIGSTLIGTFVGLFFLLGLSSTEGEGEGEGSVITFAANQKIRSNGKFCC